MKFKMPRLILDQQLHRILSKEVRKQGIALTVASKKNLEELAEVSLAIKKDGIPKNLILKKLPGDIGHGIFLHPNAEPILKDQIIAPYAGEALLVPQNLPGDFPYGFEPLTNIILTKEEQARFNSTQRYHPKRFYSMYVDAKKRGNFTRFINHSDKPNLVSYYFKIPTNSFGLTPSPLEIIYVAKKTIRPCEQLLISYEGESNSYWGPLGVKPIPITPQTFKLDSSLNLVGPS